MKEILSIVLAALIFTTASAQMERSASKEVAAKFEAFYNAAQYDSIFSLFAPVMKTALPLDKTTETLSQVKSSYGNIAKREFEKYVQTYASYKTTFERGLLTLNISIDGDKNINGLFIKPYAPDTLPVLKRNKTKMMLPFKGEWTVFWGGDTKEQNYHVESAAQKNAFDFLITNAAGQSFKTDGKINEDYYAFGQAVIAPCDGEIVLAVDGVKDNKPGILNPVYLPGNSIILKTKNNEYLVFAHFKQFSVKMKEGDMVKQGQLLGLCGNSGNSSEPHLHFHIQNVEDMTIATGAKCYFDHLVVNGISKTDYSPIKDEKIKSD